MSDLDEELYDLIADDNMNQLEKEQQIAQEAEKQQIIEDKRKLNEMLKTHPAVDSSSSSDVYVLRDEKEKSIVQRFNLLSPGVIHTQFNL